MPTHDTIEFDVLFVGGGPANLAFAISYEIRVLRLLTVGPVVQVSWISGDDYDSFFLLFGVEILKWFKTAKG